MSRPPEFTWNPLAPFGMDIRDRVTRDHARSCVPEWRNVYVHPAMLSDGDMSAAVALAARHGRVAVVTNGGRFVRLQYPGA